MSLFLEQIPESSRKSGPGPDGCGDLGVSTNKIIAVKDKLILIACDPGVDDLYGLTVLVNAHQDVYSNVRVVGIIVDYGNTTLENGINNTHRLLQVLNAHDISIFSGAKRSLVHSYHEEPDYFGLDGIHNTEFEDEIVLRTHELTGSAAISQLVREYPHQIIYLGLGPLTTLATAIRMDDTVSQNLKELFFSGCTIRGEGSQSAVADFNVLNDVEALHIVLSSFAKPITILPREIRKDFGKLTRDFRIELQMLTSPQMNMLNKIEREYLDRNNPEYYADDAIAAAIVVNDQIVMASEEHYVNVETTICEARGMTLIYRNKAKSPKPPNCRLITNFNGQLFQDILKKACSAM